MKAEYKEGPEASENFEKFAKAQEKTNPISLTVILQ